MNRTCKAVLTAFLLAGCATSSSMNWSIPDMRTGKTVALEQWLKQNPMSAVQDVSIQEISRGESASVHIIRIRKQEPMHVHQRHDLVAIVLKGTGTLTLGDRKLELKPGSIVSIPRAVPHAFVNHSSEPAVAYVTFMPAFDGVDMAPVPAAAEPKKKK